MFECLEQFLKAGDFQQPQEQYMSGTPLALYHFTAGCLPEEPGVVSLSVEDSHLVARAVLLDRDLYNEARQDNEETWLLGDTFEMMFQMKGHEDYYEFHSTPDGIRLQLHIQNYLTFRNIPHEEKICEAGLMVFNKIEPSENLWKSELRIPFDGIGLTEEKLNGSRFILVRQNHSHKNIAPEITATRIFSKTVHVPHCWHSFQNILNK